MQSNFRAVLLTFHSAPLEVRERFSLTDEQAATLLRALRETLGIQEALVVSTCNRTEVYYSAAQEMYQEVMSLMCVLKGLPSAEYAHYFAFCSDRQAVQHLFRVGIGLESQVVGDLQITNQVKRAYQLTADLDMAGPFLHRLMHTIFFTNKQVVQQTSFRDGAASVSYAAVEMIQEITSHLNGLKVLVLGVGEIGTDVVRNLAETTIKEVYICNRTYEKAAKLAEECNFQAVPFEQAWEYVEQADVIISSVNMPDPFFHKGNVAGLAQFQFKYFFDLSVPRSVDTHIEEIPGVLVFNIDQIHNRASEALERRKAAVPQVEAIVENSRQEFENWTQEMVFSPTIQKLKNALEQIRQEEIGRYTKQLNEQELQKVDAITKNIMNKIMKTPIVQLKSACRRGDAENLVEVLHDLFNLERTTTPQHEV